MRISEVDDAIYKRLPDFIWQFSRHIKYNEVGVSNDWQTIKRTTDKNFCRWFVAIHQTKEKNDIAGLMIVHRCTRRWIQKSLIESTVYYSISDFMILPEYQSSSAAKDLVNKLVRLGVAENATHISIDVDPRDLEFFTANGFAPRTDAVSLTRMMPWLMYDKPPIPPATTLLHQLSSTLAAEPSDSQDS